MDQQIFKFKVKSGTNQELLGVIYDFKTNQNKRTIDAIIQHIGFYDTNRESMCDDERKSQEKIF